VVLDVFNNVLEELAASVFRVKVKREKKLSGYIGRHFLRPFGMGRAPCCLHFQTLTIDVSSSSNLFSLQVN
jgi:hypothetical protein